MTRARSLSRLANTNAFTVDSNQRVGIGSTQPDVRLDVNGDMNVTGTLTYEDVTNVETAGITTTGGLVVTGLGATIGGITTFFGDLNFGAAGVGGTITPLGHGGFTGIVTALGFQASGVITATSFRGDGSELSGVDSSNLIDSGSTNRVAANTSGIVVTGIATVTGDVSIADKIIHTGDTNTAIRFPAADTFTVETGGSEAIRVDSSQRLLVNTATTRNNYDNGSVTSNLLHVERTAASGNAGISICANAGTAADVGAILYMGRTSATSNGGSTIVENNDLIGRISFQGADGSELVEAACIRVDVDGAPGSNDMPGRIEFHTTADGAAAATERVRITSSGNMGVGENSPQQRLHVSSTSSTYIQVQNTGNSVNAFYGVDTGGAWAGSSTNHPFKLHTNNTERLRITAAGEFIVGATAATNSSIAEFSKSVGSGAAGCHVTVENTSTDSVNNTAGIHLKTDQGVAKFFAYRAAETYLQSRAGGASDLLLQADGASNLKLLTNGSERVRINSSGAFGVGGANFGSSGQVLTSNGSGSAITWEDASGGGGITTQVGNASGIVTSMFLNDATDHKVTATGICTITTTQAGTEGQSHTIRIVNSGTANVGFSTYFLFPSGSAPSLPTADGAVSLISFTVHDSVGAGCTQLLAGASVNFS